MCIRDRERERERMAKARNKTCQRLNRVQESAYYEWF